MNKFFIWGFRQLRPRRATQTSKKQHVHEEFVGKSKSQLFGDHAFWQISLSSLLFCFYSVLARFEHQKIVIIKWNTIIRRDEVCKQLVLYSRKSVNFAFISFAMYCRCRFYLRHGLGYSQVPYISTRRYSTLQLLYGVI